MNYLKHQRGKVLHGSAEHNDQNEFQRRIPAKPVQEKQHQHAAASVDGQPWAMHDATVHEHSVRDQVQAHLPHPSHEGQHEKHHQQRPDRVVPEIVQAHHPFPLPLFRNGVKSRRVHCSLQSFPVCLQLKSAAAPGLHLLQIFALPDGQPENLRQKFVDSLQLQILLGEFPALLFHIPIRLLQRLCAGPLKQIAVIEEFPIVQSFFLTQTAKLRVVFSHHGHLVGRREENIGNPHGEDSQQLPSQKGQLKNKALPFVPLHHLSGEGDGLHRPHGRIFGQNARHQIIGIMLDDAPRDGQAP